MATLNSSSEPSKRSVIKLIPQYRRVELGNGVYDYMQLPHKVVGGIDLAKLSGGYAQSGSNPPERKTMTNQSPAEALRQQISKTLQDGTMFYDGSENKIFFSTDSSVDAIMELVTAYAATVEREAERTAFLSATTWATKYPEADKIWHEMLADAALQGTEE